MYYIDCNTKIGSINCMHKLFLLLNICLLINYNDILASLRVIGNDKYGGGALIMHNNLGKVSGYTKNRRKN